mmetsp:Transcript_3299/g.7718  ORF Transcript_3299/g.7718 Transcript_3299/m.7718 type:complete len:341 (-) Transcript_3299:85-1107(-)
MKSVFAPSPLPLPLPLLLRLLLAAILLLPASSIAWPMGVRAGAGATPPIRAAGVTSVGLPSAAARGAARFANKYPECPSTRVDAGLTPAEAEGADAAALHRADVKRLVAAVKSSGIRAVPFKSSVHICQPFSEELFDKIFLGFPPKAILYTLGEKRWKGEFDQLVKLKAKERTKWPTFERDIAAWKRVESAVFDPTFERFIFGALGIKKKAANKEIRIQLDEGGYYIGVHPDNPVKILTMQFYMPSDDHGLWTYGTCLHDDKQAAVARKQVPKHKVFGAGKNAPCAAKFPFANNTGYAFSVHKSSWHSVEKVPKFEGNRRTFMINWYSAGKLPPRGNNGR